MRNVSIEQLIELKGQHVGQSDWVLIDQERINAFAECTGDHQFIHVDPARAAAETPFGGTIAHGFLTLSLLAPFAEQAAVMITGATSRINYGCDRLRFVRPVRCGRRVRGRFALEDAVERRPGQWQLRYQVAVEIDGEPEPALAAEWLTLQIMPV